jgi:uncharacterized protein
VPTAPGSPQKSAVSLRAENSPLPLSGGARKPGSARGGKFVLKKGSTGKFHFNLLAGNGQVIATSEAYESKESALNGIKSVKTNAPEAKIDDQTEK